MSIHRKQLDKLLEWWGKSTRKPLILRGARQVGKSTLVSLFAEAQKLTLNEINLDRHPELDVVFATMNPEKIISELESLPKIPGISEQSLLFLDEIQSVEHALPALRYFFEERPDIPIIAAGSLLEFLLRDHSFSMPVGRITYLSMGPLVFTEFLSAVGEPQLFKQIQNYSGVEPLGQVAHQRCLELLRTYFFVGGMPEAVDQFVKSGSHRHATEVHRSILDTYRDDFPKYIGSRNLARFLKVFAYAARSVGKKVKYSHFSPHHQSITVKADLELLCLARLLSKVTHCACNGLPLEADQDDRIYKLLFLDIGLMNTFLGLSWSDIVGMSELRLVNEGVLAEQFVGQHLLEVRREDPGSELNYWLREGKGVNAEVDFVITVGGHIVPIEVKAGASGSLRSLHQLMGEKKLSLAIRLDLNPPSQQWIETTIQTSSGPMAVSYQLLSLPLYLVEKIPQVAAAYFLDEAEKSRF